MTNTKVKVTVSAFEGRNDYLLRGETKVCEVTGYHVSLVHDCKKGGC